jgi:HEAT repeat protein
VLHALSIIGRPVLAGIAPLLVHPDKEVRFCATYLLSALVYPEAVALVALQLRDGDADVRRVAGKALRKFREMEQFPEVLGELRNDLSNPDPRPRRGAAEALGALGDEEAVMGLIGVLNDPDESVALSAETALINLTKQNYGKNHHEWTLWWEQNRHRDRIEWLIDGLVHGDLSIRAASIAELEELTGKSFGYSFDMPRRDRERIRRRFLSWWSMPK